MSKNDEFCIKTEELCIQNDGICKINLAFAKNGLREEYSVKKLDGWRGNALYRYKCIQRQYLAPGNI